MKIIRIIKIKKRILSMAWIKKAVAKLEKIGPIRSLGKSIASAEKRGVVMNKRISKKGK